MLELILDQRYRVNGVPVDLGPYRNHGTPIDTGSEPGAIAGMAITFPNSGSRVSMKSVTQANKSQWAPLIALRIELVAKIDPHAALQLTLVEGEGAFWFGVGQTALEAVVQGPPGADTYVRSADAFAPDGMMHPVPANQWVTLGLNHDGYARVQLLIDGNVVGETTVQAGVPLVTGGGVSVGNGVAGGRPLKGAIDTVRIWRADPRAIEREFFDRPYTEATARCCETMLRAVVDWARTHPGDAATLSDLLSTRSRSAVRALLLLPAHEQLKLRKILDDFLRLWRAGRIDGHEMWSVLQRWIAAMRHNGLNAAVEPDADLEALRRRLGFSVSLDCDPALARFAQLFEHAARTS
jgi:hypothetical protein